MRDPKPSKRIQDPDLLRRFRLEHVGEPCDLCETRVGRQAHHKIFRSQGGGDVEDNLLWLCLSCHDNAHGIKSVRYDFPVS